MDQAERAANLFVRRFTAINEEYLRIIGERIRAIGRISPTDLYRLERMRDIGEDMDKIRRRLAAETGKSLAELEALFQEAARAAMKPYDGLVSAEPYLQNEMAATMAAAQYVGTARTMVNLSNTTVVSAPYQALVDRAVSAVQLGTESYQQAIRSTLRQTAMQGLCVQDATRKVRYQSGLTRRLDTAARQNVLDGFRALMQRTREETGKAFGADGVEITAHELCALDHLPYQGRQFSLEEFEQLNQTLKRPIARGMWNCSHAAEPILLGISEPAYTEEELSMFRRSSTEAITIDGRTKTRYEWTQVQRRMETEVRRQKDVAIAAKAAGDDSLRRECQQKINDLRKRYGAISRAAGLDERRENMAVPGFRAVKTKEQLEAARAKRAAEMEAQQGATIHRLMDKAAKGETLTREEYTQAGHVVRMSVQQKAAAYKKTIQEQIESLIKERDAIDDEAFEALLSGGDKTDVLKKEGKITKKITALRSQLDVIDRNAFKAELSKYRSMGFQSSAKMQKFIEDQFDYGFGLGDSFKTQKREIMESIANACDYYPSDWLKQTVRYGKMKVERTGRAYYSHGTSTISLGEDENDDFRTAIHEMAHRFEKVVPGLGTAERSYYQYRTANEPLVPLGGTYEKWEKTRADGFVRKYMGKDYGGENVFELCSMGFELLYTSQKSLAKDHDMYDWLVGLLLLK